MVNDKLCFVLGAGASAHFGYPLGNELVEAMEVFANRICFIWNNGEIEDFEIADYH